MKSFKEVYNASKMQMLEAKKTQIDNEKVALLEGIKTELCITCNLKELPKQRQDQVLNMLYEFWSPKKGINKAGKAFLEEGRIAIDPKSSVANIKMFAQKEVKEVVQRLQENIQHRCQKKIMFKPLFEMVFKIVSDKIQNDNL